MLHDNPLAEIMEGTLLLDRSLRSERDWDLQLFRIWFNHHCQQISDGGDNSRQERLACTGKENT